MAFPSLTTAFGFVEQGSGAELGTISYALPDQVAEGASAVPGEG